MDLTARAVAYLVLIQDIIYDLEGNKQGEETVSLLDHNEDSIFEKLGAALKKYNDSAQPSNPYLERASELICIKGEKLEGLEIGHLILKRSKALLVWLREYKSGVRQKLYYYDVRNVSKKELKNQTSETLKFLDRYPAPQQWRTAVRSILYLTPESRIRLAQALNYLPLLVVIARDGGNLSLQDQRTLQEEWETDKVTRILIEDDQVLFNHLINKEIALPFDVVFKQELAEIDKSRSHRNQASGLPNSKICVPNGKVGAGVNEDNDPYLKAAGMGLWALALSGGGIRSATYNLGILQGLAKAGILSRFDYLSVVSGGGYIGAWLAAWIKRDGSLLKVQDRLDPEKSSDPRGEEVRPIRWLRMFSNYLAPNASIMSTDSWTVGMTWLRNTLLNQLIIILLLCTVLSTGYCLYLYWQNHLWSVNSSNGVVLVIISIFLLSGALMAGFGMRGYHNLLSSKRVEPAKRARLITLGLLFLSLITSFLISSWFFVYATKFNVNDIDFGFIWSTFAISAAGLLLVAYLGRYFSCLPKYNIYQKVGAWVLIVSFSVFAALIGSLLLGVVWKAILLIYDALGTTLSIRIPFKDKAVNVNFEAEDFREKLIFIVGTPLVLEVLSFTVVLRMAFLGKYFPDDRREWWGRLGALVHRFILCWLLLSTLGLFSGEIIQLGEGYLMVVAGSWFALIAVAVRFAFSSTTPAQKDLNNTASKVKDVIVRIAPYLFIAGMLILAAEINKRLMGFWGINKELMEKTDLFYRVVALTAMLALGTFILSWRVGVNEFSMHHFYRNRLMRGYLAATRRRTERDKSSNAFTGFDSKDDLKLALLTTGKGYQGPYLIINTTLNATQVTDLDRQDRKAESFVFTPLFCGFDISRTRSVGSLAGKSYEYGFRPTGHFAYKGGPGIGTAMAISGAAANPNQGYHSSSATAFLMTVFNARLGWWMGNPRRNRWKRSDPRFGLTYLIYDLLGKTDTKRDYVCLSDGGHFDNMGLYELIRRRVTFIVLGDGEQDSNFACEGLANAIRRCRIDFGVEIVIDVAAITERDDKTQRSTRHYSVGNIWYPEDPADKPSGKLLYLKTSLTGDESVDVKEYAAVNPKFPHQSTSDQFFSEAQFESYRKLGLHVIESALPII